MNILDTLKQLRDDIKSWVTNNLNALNAKIDEKTIPIDSELSATSTNPVQNQAISKEIDSINERVGDKPVATQISQAINAQEHFSGDYNDLTNAPNITEDESGEINITDESGNVIFKADADGIHTTAVSLNGEAAASEKYVDEAIANIDIPEVDFTGYATEDFVTTAVENAKEEIGESIVSESEEWKVVDSNGNIIFSVDAEGVHTTNLTLNGENVEDIMENRLAALVDSAPETLNTLDELAQALGDDPNFATTIATQIGNKVDKVDGKGLSSNDYTTDEKNKLAGIATGATANTGTITEISVNGTSVATSGKANITVPTKTSDLTNDSGFKTTDTNTTYTFATGDSNGQIKVTPSGGAAQNVSVKGLGTAAYTASTAYATAAQGTLASNAMPKSGGTFTGAVTAANDTAYTTYKVRNAAIVSATPSSMTNGTIAFVYS